MPHTTINSATPASSASATTSTTSCGPRGNKSRSTVTRMCWLERIPIAAPKKVSTTDSRIAIGSGQEAALCST